MEERYWKQIEDLYRSTYNLMFEYARSALSNDSLAEEAVQEAFRIACQKPEALWNSPCPEGWLVKTLKNVINNTLRSQAKAARLLKDYIHSCQNELSVSEDLEEIEILYGDIGESEELKLLKEMALEGKSYLEMAQARGISVEADAAGQGAFTKKTGGMMSHFPGDQTYME